MALQDDPWGKVGDRSALTAQQNMRGSITASPTGRNLLVGSDVEFVFESDPTGTVGTWPDGARGIWPDGLGNLMIGRYTRDTGWCSAQLVP